MLDSPDSEWGRLKLKLVADREPLEGETAPVVFSATPGFVFGLQIAGCDRGGKGSKKGKKI